ncbi:MAG TPA: YdcF family protein, partial [Candidatus Paceibacterota bacterium]
MKEYIVVLGGMVEKDDDGRWRTSSFGDIGDRFGFTLDRLRVDAAAILWQEDKEKMIIASGGRGQLKNISDAPTLSFVIKAELVELGVPPDAIIEEDKSGNTFQQLRNSLRISNDTNGSQLDIVSNRYHLSRIVAMLAYSQDLLKLKSFPEIKPTIKLISAEKVLLTHDFSKWDSPIGEAYESEKMKERIAIEKKG